MKKYFLILFLLMVSLPALCAPHGTIVGYNASDSAWVPLAVSGDGVATYPVYPQSFPVGAALGYNAASGTFSPLPVNASGALIVEGGASSEWTASGSTQLYTEKSVGIGTTTPDVTKALHVVGDGRFDGDVTIPETFKLWFPSTAYPTRLSYITSGNYGRIEIFSQDTKCVSFDGGNTNIQEKINIRSGKQYTAVATSGSASNPQYSIGDGGMFAEDPDGDIGFSNNDIETMRTTADNNVLIGDTTDDGVNKLQVTGNAKVAGSLAVTVTPTYTDNASALTGGLVAGDIYRLADGTLMITY